MRKSVISVLALIPQISFAHYTPPPSGFGGLAYEILGPVSVLSDFVSTGSLVIGVCMLFGSIARYFRYRRNELEASLSSVVVLFLIGVSLVSISLIHMYYENQFPFLRHNY